MFDAEDTCYLNHSVSELRSTNLIQRSLAMAKMLYHTAFGERHAHATIVCV